jgi:hypothetical protein
VTFNNLIFKQVHVPYIVTLDQDFERKLQVGLKLNEKLMEFSKTLTPEEQKGLGTLMKLAGFVVENGGIALFAYLHIEFFYFE